LADNRLPKLRPIDAQPVMHGGRPAILLRDPLRLSPKTVIIPQHLAPLLALCDGTRDAGGLRASLAVRYGLPLTDGIVTQVLDALDEGLLLDNDRYLGAREQALRDYREAPYREPALAGASYPAEPEALAGLLQSYLDQVADHATNAHARGLICPHIDYARGGRVYAEVCHWAADALRSAKCIIVLGTDHYGGEGRITLTRQSYATPYGVLPTATDIVDELAKAMSEEVAYEEELHHRSEHSVELAAAWLHHLRDGLSCELVPVLCGSFAHFARGDASPAEDPMIAAFVGALRQFVLERDALVVSAADLAHVGPAFGGRPVDLVARAQLEINDREIIGRACAGDAPGFFGALQRTRNVHNVCGLPPIYLALRLLEPVTGLQMAYERCPADEVGTSFVTVCGVLWQ